MTPPPPLVISSHATGDNVSPVRLPGRLLSGSPRIKKTSRPLSNHGLKLIPGLQEVEVIKVTRPFQPKDASARVVHPALRQEKDAIEPLQIGRHRIDGGHRCIGRGEAAAEVAPVGLSQVGPELHLIRAAQQRVPVQREVAA